MTTNNLNVTAKSRVFVGPVATGISTVEQFEALTPWTEINGTENLGEWGPEGTPVSFVGISDGWERTLKGSLKAGTMELVVARDPFDEGQKLLREGAKQYFKYAFRVELNDKPTPTGENTVFYFKASVMSAKNQFNTGDDITKTVFSLGIDGETFEILADWNVVFAPVAGALPAADEGVPYTTTIAATGGSGSPTYAVTAGALPAGLTLNAATGVISGTPSADGTFAFTITATFSAGGKDEAAYSLVVDPA